MPDQPPSLPLYNQGVRVATATEQKPIMKMMGKMMAARMPKLASKGKISSQSVTIKHKKKVKYW